MKLYNTLTRKKEEFTPLDNTVKIYACGPTVYNYFHIGNARPFVVFDTLRRYMLYRGMQVKFVQNFTDIDDKMINKANAEGITVKQLADKFIEEYFVDAKGLGITPADVHPKATESMDDIIALVSTLIEKGFAYEIKGDVYFRTKKFKEYGKLSHMPLDDLEAGARIDVNETKEDPMDFAVWKAKKEGEPFWNSPWGEGRPGWHIECSAMANRHLGKTIDIHCGGQDLSFPHHENEIAQSEAANGQEFARFWLHNGYINIDNHKMSKSLGNFFTVRDVAEKYGYEVIRFFILSSHYRSPINYSTDIINQCENALSRLYGCLENLDFLLSQNTFGENTKDLQSYREKFNEAMDDDLNTADAIAVLFDLAKDINIFVSENDPSKEFLQAAKALYLELSGVLGFLQKQKDEISDEIKDLVEQRTQAKKSKDFAKADQIRDKLKAMGVTLMDTPQGVKIVLDK